MKEKWLYAVVNLLPKGMFRTLSKLYDKALAKIVIDWKHFNHFCTNASPKMFDTDPKNVLGLCSAAIMKIIEKSYKICMMGFSSTKTCIVSFSSSPTC